MNRYWRILLAIWLALALSWQGAAAASMVMCHGAGQGWAAKMGGQGLAPAMDAPAGHDHAHHGHAASHHPESAAPDSATSDSATPDSASPQASTSLAGSPDGHACPVCAGCSHALGLTQAQVQVAAHAAPSVPPDVPLGPLVRRAPSVPDKPPRV